MVGSSTRRNAMNDEQPSTIAASSSSFGTDSNEMRIMKVENGSWNIVITRATPTSELDRPALLSRT